MAEAARLAVPEDDPALSLSIYDTAGGSDGARAAATSASGADIVLGPLFGADVPAVRAGLRPAVPLVSFTNDAEALGADAYSIGVTPAQSINAVLRYARGQGVRRVAVLSRSGVFGQRVARAAERIAPRIGLTLTGAHFADPEAGSDAIRTLIAQEQPQAVLLPDGGASLAAFARALSGSGLQILGTAQWGGERVAATSGLSGAWFAAPDPSGFTRFSDLFEARTRAPAGLLAGLAFDAAEMCRTLAGDGRPIRAGLSRTNGFDGVTGRFRLTSDGRCLRDMAILSVASTGVRLIDRIAAV